MTKKQISTKACKTSDKEQTDNSHLPLNENAESSRFSRRKFIRSAAGTSPLLLTLKSPVAWGKWNDMSKTSLRVHLSHNPSMPENAWCEPKDPNYWLECYQGQNEIVEKELGRQGCYAYQKLFKLCMIDDMDSWRQNVLLNDKWQFMLDEYCNPTLLEALLNENQSLTIKFRKQRQNGEYRIKEIDLARYAPDFFPYLSCAMLNCLFHPSPIDYFDKDSVKEMFYQKLNQIINEILVDLNDTNFKNLDKRKYSNNMQKFSESLNKWDEYD